MLLSFSQYNVTALKLINKCPLVTGKFYNHDNTIMCVNMAVRIACQTVKLYKTQANQNND